MSGQKRKGAASRRLKPLSPSTSRPSHPHCSRKKRSLFLFSMKSRHLFNVFLFSRADSPADPGGPGADSERQRVCEEDQHGHREDLHPSRVQLLCWWHQGSRCLSGNALYHIPNFIHIKFHQYIDILSSSIENFPTFCVTFSFKAPLKTPALTVLIHRVMAGVR